jgi:aminoglycoside 2''-phosphotransferase
MMIDKAYWHDQIQRVMPDLEINSLELHQEGLVNDVLIVNDEWVIRFTRTAWGRELMATEACLLRYLQHQVSLSVPSPVTYADGVLVYPHLSGDTFLRETWAAADETQQQALADQLGQFLRELHGTPTTDLDWDLPHTLAPVTRETWLDIHERIIDLVYPLLLSHQVDWVEDLFEPALHAPDFFDFDPVLIHGDLVPYHILYSSQKGCLRAVIDFGVAGLGDPATDLGSLINTYGETFVSKLKRAYPHFEEYLTRARFYAQAIELQWVLLGIESGEYYWFTAHLGSARDIRKG